MRRAWFLHCLLWSCLGPIIYLTIVGGPNPWYIITGAASGSSMAVGLYYFIFHLAPALRRTTFVVSVLVQLIVLLGTFTLSFFLGVWATMAAANHASPLEPRIMSNSVRFFQFPMARTGYFVAAFGILTLLVVWQLSRKLGPGVLFNWLTGRYHRPREEERIFMFLDLRGSTALGESLGNLKFSSLIQEFFVDLTTPVVESKGEVSHYIGDEAVITWKVRSGLENANCVRLFFRMQDEINARAAHYRAKYGVVPSFKAGLHVGKVVACEVGYLKSEVVYHGDVLNTASRIQSLCGDLGADLLLSGELAACLPFVPDLQWVAAGTHALKGKAGQTDLYQCVRTEAGVSSA